MTEPASVSVPTTVHRHPSTSTGDELPERGMHVDPVRDQLDVGIVLQERGDGQAWRAVLEAAHGVEEMRRRRGTGGERLARLVDQCRRMPERHRDARTTERPDQVGRAGELGCHRKEPQTICQRLDRLGRDICRGSELHLIMGAAPGVRQERSLEVEPERFGAVAGRARHPRTHALGEGGQVVERRRDGGGQERGHAATEQGPCHPIEGVPVAHRVVAAPAMDVHVDETGCDVGGILRNAGCVDIHGRDEPVIDRHAPRSDAVIEDQPPRDRMRRQPGKGAVSSSGSSTSNWTSRPYRPAT